MNPQTCLDTIFREILSPTFHVNFGQNSLYLPTSVICSKNIESGVNQIDEVKTRGAGLLNESKDSVMRGPTSARLLDFSMSTLLFSAKMINQSLAQPSFRYVYKRSRSDCPMNDLAGLY